DFVVNAPEATPQIAAATVPIPILEQAGLRRAVRRQALRSRARPKMFFAQMGNNSRPARGGRIAQFMLRQNSSLKHFLPMSISFFARPLELRGKGGKAKGWIALPNRVKWWLTLREIRTAQTQKRHVTTTCSRRRQVRSRTRVARLDNACSGLDDRLGRFYRLGGHRAAGWLGRLAACGVGGDRRTYGNCRAHLRLVGRDDA